MSDKLLVYWAGDLESEAWDLIGQHTSEAHWLKKLSEPEEQHALRCIAKHPKHDPVVVGRWSLPKDFGAPTCDSLRDVYGWWDRPRKRATVEDVIQVSRRDFEAIVSRLASLEAAVLGQKIHHAVGGTQRREIEPRIENNAADIRDLAMEIFGSAEVEVVEDAEAESGWQLCVTVTAPQDIEEMAAKNEMWYSRLATDFPMLLPGDAILEWA
jgi:hypothetical protein